MMLDHLQTTEVNRTLERSYMFDDNVLDCRDLFDHTPLHYAVIREHLGCIELLLDCGADLNVKDKQGATPLHLVCRLGHSAQVRGQSVIWGSPMFLFFNPYSLPSPHTKGRLPLAGPPC